jgi:16S rRNA (cytosine967-C5)-methyltransferase
MDGPSQARRLALRVLERVERAGAYADLALHSALDRHRLALRERAFATELVYGTLRWRGRLDFVLSHVLARGLDKVEPRVATLLRLGAYQILFCEGVPDAAAVSESVRLARAAGLERACGLVNATLRHLARARHAIALPDLERDPVGHLSHALSIPSWIAERWIERYGSEEAAALALASNRVPPRTVRANRRRTDRDALLAELRSRFPEATPCRFASDGIVLGARGNPARDPAFLDGRFTIQDEASQAVVELLAPRAGERVLDACAAPGAKATAVAERVHPDGEVVALDRHAHRLGLLSRDARRLGLDNVRALQADASKPLIDLLPSASFDRVLVDAPCSGLGTLRRNPDARWRLRPDSLARLAEVQRAILAHVAPLLRPGGTLVYSTCTLAPEENEAVVDSFLAERPELRRTPADVHPAFLRPLVGDDGALRSLPHRHHTDGFFAVRLERRP